MNIYGVATGTDTYSIDVNAAPGDKLQRGDIVTASFLNANTGAATLEVNGGGRFPILLSGVAISAGVLSTGVDFQMTFTGSTFSLDSASSSSLSADEIAVLLGYADAAAMVAAIAGGSAGTVELESLKTSAYTTTSSDQFVPCSHASTPFTITIHAATGSGQKLIIKNRGAAAVTLARSGSDTFDGALTVVLAQYSSATLVDGASGAWDII